MSAYLQNYSQNCLSPPSLDLDPSTKHSSAFKASPRSHVTEKGGSPASLIKQEAASTPAANHNFTLPAYSVPSVTSSYVPPATEAKMDYSSYASYGYPGYLKAENLPASSSYTHHYYNAGLPLNAGLNPAANQNLLAYNQQAWNYPTARITRVAENLSDLQLFFFNQILVR